MDNIPERPKKGGRWTPELRAQLRALLLNAKVSFAKKLSLVTVVESGNDKTLEYYADEIYKALRQQ